MANLIDSKTDTLRQQNQTTINEFAQIQAAFLHESPWENCQIKDKGPYSLVLQTENIRQTLITADIWQDYNLSHPYLKQLANSENSLICIGTYDQLAALPNELLRPDVQTLCLPATLSNIGVSLQNLKNLQSRLYHSHKSGLELETNTNHIKHVMSISRELNGERDIPKLLNLILEKAREFCCADAGSIYTVESKGNDLQDGKLHFRYTQNSSITQNLSEFTLPINEGSIVGNAVIHKRAINIPDLYKLDENPHNNPYGARHDKTWDLKTGYQTHSVLTVPMYDISHKVIGVIQLINRKNCSSIKLDSSKKFEDHVQPFNESDTEYAEIIAQQAGIALENANFQEEIQTLFDGFVNASVYAIEQRDPTTSGHSHRVAHLTVGLAQLVNSTPNGVFANTHFNEDQIKEIEYASLLHDFGKLGVRENVLVKAKKLHPWQLELLLRRFEMINMRYENEYLQNCLNYMKNPDQFPMGVNLDSFAFEKTAKLRKIKEYENFIKNCNEPTILEQGGFERLKDIANCSYLRHNGKSENFLTSDELKALSVSRGSLTREEFAEIQSHVTHTFEFLRQIPWGQKLANVPQIAAKHHEKLDGSGYPTSAEASEIPLQTRMMTIADIFDALTASDRPYKKAVPVDKALDILQMEVTAGKVDKNLFKVFLESRTYESILDPNFSYSRANTSAA